MGKRSTFARRERDYYASPESVVLPLLPHLIPCTRFVEPCAGDGRLVRHLEKHGHRCVDAFDIEPQHESVRQGDALTDPVPVVNTCITNPPWGRDFLHPFILRWRALTPTWLLFDADWAHTVQAAPFLPYCRKIVSVGRVKWIEGSKHTSLDSAAWFLFSAMRGETQFFGR